MTHYDITVGNYIKRDAHCDIIMDHDIAWAHIISPDITMHTDAARVLIYYVVLQPIMLLLFA